METGAGEALSPLWSIIVVAAIAAALQFGWALQLALLTPYVQTLGVTHVWVAFIWLCGPISGLLVQPIVGYNSDRSTSRFGRSRPYIAGGAFLVALAVFLIGFAKDIGHLAGDSLEKFTKPRAVAVFVSGFWILDVGNNMLQGPCRAFLADLSANDHKRIRISNGWYSFFMGVGNILGYAAGSYSNLHKIFPFTKTIACDVYCANLKSCFIIDIILLLSVTTTAIVIVKETPLTSKDVVLNEEERKSFKPFFREVLTSFMTLKKPMWILLFVTLLNWIAWFPFMLYDTDWMGREVYGGNVGGTASQEKLYNDGVCAGALGLMINSIALGFASLGLEPISHLIGGVNNLWGVVNFILAACLAGTAWIANVAETWRASNGPPIVAPPSNIKNSALAVFGLLGVPLAVTYSIPFALASIYCSIAGGGQGLFLGVLNLSIVIAQMFISVVSGPLDAAFGGGNQPAFMLGSVVAAISALLAIVALPNPLSLIREIGVH